jgi:hypothetical protein
MLRLHKMRPRLDMVMISINSKCAFEQRMFPILLNHNPRPPNIRPFRTFVTLQPSLTLKHPIFHPIHRFRILHRPIRSKVCNGSPVLNNIMIGRERQLDPLFPGMEIKRQVEVRERVHSM